MTNLQLFACKHMKAVVRGVSEVRGAIQHLISLLRDQPPFAPEIRDYIVRIYNQQSIACNVPIYS